MQLLRKECCCMAAENLAIANYLRVAHEDLVGANLLLQGKNRNAIYLCAQAAEKTIIAVLISEHIKFEKDHQLYEMVRKIPDANPFKIDFDELADLIIYLTTYRYPHSNGRIPPVPHENEVKEWLEKVDKNLRAAVSHFMIDLNGHTPAKNIGPRRN